MIAVLGILSLILVPQFSLYGDKAMGTTALADVKSIQSMAIAYNMDNITPLNLGSLAPLVGMTAKKTTGWGTTDAAYDASGSKAIQYNTTTNQVTYYYRRGDAQLKCVLSLNTQEQVWDTTVTDAKRQDALAQGLKITGTKDGKTALTATGTVGQLGKGTITFPTT